MVGIEKLRDARPIMPVVKSEDCDKGILTVRGKMIAVVFDRPSWAGELNSNHLCIGCRPKLGALQDTMSPSRIPNISGKFCFELWQVR